MSEPDQQADSGRFKRLDQAELDKILESHAKFAGGRSGGQRANLGSYDLSYLTSPAGTCRTPSCPARGWRTAI